MQRRSFLLGAGATLLLAALTKPNRAFASGDLDEAIAHAIGDAKPVEGGPLKLELPELAENGNVVPFTASVESPMTDADHIRSLHVFAPKNPRVHVASYFFTPRSGRAYVMSRMRLAESQEVVAVAQASDGRAWLTRAFVEVTIGGCDV